MSTLGQQEDQNETTELRAVASSLDSISMAVGSGHFVSKHRFGFHIETAMGRSPRLTVSRYYWDLSIPVVVDFVRDLRFGELELATKKQYFAQNNIRYILVKDIWDGEGAESALLAFEPEADQVKAIVNAAKPLMGPRRRRG